MKGFIISRYIEDLSVTFCCCFFYGRIVVSLTHFPLPFSILFTLYMDKVQEFRLPLEMKVFWIGSDNSICRKVNEFLACIYCCTLLTYGNIFNVPIQKEWDFKHSHPNKFPFMAWVSPYMNKTVFGSDVFMIIFTASREFLAHTFVIVVISINIKKNE